MLDSLRLLTDAMASFTAHCVDGLEVDSERTRALLDRSLMLVTALAPEIGYDKAAKIAKHAHEMGTTLRDAALDDGPQDQPFRFLAVGPLRCRRFVQRQPSLDRLEVVVRPQNA